MQHPLENNQTYKGGPEGDQERSKSFEDKLLGGLKPLVLRKRVNLIKERLASFDFALWEGDSSLFFIWKTLLRNGFLHYGEML